MASIWYYMQGGEKVGPITVSQLKQSAISGQLKPSDLLWKEGMPEWIPAGNTKGLFPEPATQTASPSLEEPTSAIADLHAPSTSSNVKAAATAGVNVARTVMRHAKDSLKQSFGDAAKHTRSQIFASLKQVLKHPFRLSFVTFVFVLASVLALLSLVGTVLFPVFVMGYITCIRSTLDGEPMGLERFIAFMRHGWDSLWHLLMLIAAFFVTMGAMLAPFAIVAVLLYFVFGTVGAAIGEIGSHGSTSTTYQQNSPGYDYPQSSPGREPSKFSQWISETIAQFLGLGLAVILMVVWVILLTPIAAALILFFYLILEVSRGSSNGPGRFELVYDAFSKMLAMGRSHWKELLTSGLSVSICLIGIGVVASLLAYLLSSAHLYVLAGWVIEVLVPAAICFFIVYVNVFMTMTSLSLAERRVA